MNIYQTEKQWESTAPTTLVIACSDGRFQEEVDAFLHSELGIRRYDRFYVPGGAGALASSGFDFTRAHDFRSECRFLINAHRIDQAILLFHGPAEDGPESAACADYKRKSPGKSATELRKQQDEDAAEIIRDGLGSSVTLRVFHTEVTAEGFVRFVPVRG
ncbi:MAG: hypothetical protein JSW71_14765 [Gemmatimonadota bacterium]|nr:MAG: hypothetical protein JSW71_14765 [Gemmatimonadota bacterium]